ncbi:MAG: BrnT family toxin [Desulfamplus sp.]|nr:BrnT family toxin [Desulfamplus sp.]
MIFKEFKMDGEQRFITLGLLNSIVVVIVHTETETEIRIISMRKATKNEQKLYFKNIY